MWTKVAFAGCLCCHTIAQYNRVRKGLAHWTWGEGYGGRVRVLCTGLSALTGSSWSGRKPARSPYTLSALHCCFRSAGFSAEIRRVR